MAFLTVSIARPRKSVLLMLKGVLEFVVRSLVRYSRGGAGTEGGRTRGKGNVPALPLVGGVWRAVWDENPDQRLTRRTVALEKDYSKVWAWKVVVRSESVAVAVVWIEDGRTNAPRNVYRPAAVLPVLSPPTNGLFASSIFNIFSLPSASTIITSA